MSLPIATICIFILVLTMVSLLTELSFVCLFFFFVFFFLNEWTQTCLNLADKIFTGEIGKESLSGKITKFYSCMFTFHPTVHLEG